MAARKGMIVIVSSPSGAGKTTVVKNAIKKLDNAVMGTTATSRAMREGEVDGRDYFFFSKSDFAQKLKEDFFWEHTEYCGNFYGVPKAPAIKAINEGNDVFLVIESEGMRAVKKTNPDDVVTVFIMIRSMEQLKERLEGRGESPDLVKQRMTNAKNEIVNYDQYDYFIFNDTVEESAAKLEAIVEAERQKLHRQTGLDKMIKKEFL